MESTSADSSSNQKREADEECNVNASSSQAVGATPTQGKKNARNYEFQKMVAADLSPSSGSCSLQWSYYMENVPSGSQVHKPHRSFILSLVDGLLVEADGMDLVCDREERQQANEQEKEGKRKRNRSQPRHVKRLRGANCNNHYPVLERIPAVAGQDHRPWCSVTGCKYKTRDRCIVCKLPFCNSSSRQCFRVHLIEQDRKDLSKEEIITSVHAPLFNSDILPHTSS